MAINDTCIYLEAATGDRGNHVTNKWWLSPDIELIGANAGPGKADPNPANNTVNVLVHKKSGCIVDPNTGAINIDVWIGDPTASGMSPLLNTTKITNAASRPAVFDDDPGTLPVAGRATSFLWQLQGTPAEQPGHKCLVARCYPDVDTPSSTTFDLPNAQHVAQRNICIVPCGSPCGFEVQVFTANPDVSEMVILRAEADIRPTKLVQRVLLPLLKETAGFERLTQRWPPKFALTAKEFPRAKARDYTGEPSRKGFFGRHRTPNFELSFEMPPQQITTATFETDLDGVEYGDAVIYHLMHLNPKRRVQGGLTLVMVRTKR